MNTHRAQEHGMHTPSLLYPESLALGLLLLSHTNIEFRMRLRSLLQLHGIYAPLSETTHVATPLLYPQDERTALKRAVWIINHGTPESIELLAKALNDKPYESPKAVVLGITLGVLPIGVLGHDKPGKKVTVITEHSLTDTDTIVQSGTRLSLTLLERAIHDAAGELKRVDPDMNDWFFGEKSLTFFKASQETLSAMVEELSKNDIPFTVTESEYGIAGVAVAPAINPETLTLQWDLSE